MAQKSKRQCRVQVRQNVEVCTETQLGGYGRIQACMVEQSKRKQMKARKESMKER